MTEADFALLQEARRIANSLETIANCCATVSGLLNLRPTADLQEWKKEVMAEIRRAVLDGQKVATNQPPAKRWFLTAEVAKALGVKPATIRGRCSAGLVGAEKWGKEWKIPAAEMDRLKRDGLPPLPQPAEAEIASPA